MVKKYPQKQNSNLQKHYKLLRFWRAHTLMRVFTIIAGTIAVMAVVMYILNSFVFTPVKNPIYGVSFSVKQANNLGLDWQANYLALLDDLQFSHLRLMSYWDYIEPNRGEFDFYNLDWQMDKAAEKGAQVSLSVGLRQPRWPECHQPEWASSLQGHDWKQALYAYMEVVVKRYKNHPALASWQLENEGMNNWFGACDPPDRTRLVEEFDLMKQWDTHHPVMMSLSDQHGLPLRQPVPDAYGFSVYRIIWNDKIPPQGYAHYPTPIWYHRARAEVIKLIHDRPLFIHELQMEPWGPRDTKYLSTEEQDKSMSPQQIPKSFTFARQLGMQDIDLWGGEWWYWRKVNGDPVIWETVREQLRQQ